VHDQLKVERVEIGNAAVSFADRSGGVSRPPYDALNVADHVGDSPVAVSENRRRLAQAVARHDDTPDDPDLWVWPRQVHGATVVRAVDASSGGREADAVVTATVGLPLVVQVADCVPVALVSDDAVAAVHAGWKGLEAGVVANAVEAVRRSDTARVDAWIGPSVWPCHYAFGAADLQRLVQRFGADVAGRTLAGAPALDLPRAVETVLRRTGVQQVARSGCCTAHDPARWFSHRRDGPTGRHAMVVVKRA
jgi:YfiH family protein